MIINGGKGYPFPPFLFLLYIMLISGCGSVFQSPAQRAASLAAENGWVADSVSTSTFVIQTFRNIQSVKSRRLVFYIEGDGRAWQAKNRMPADPTPQHPMVLQLAIQHAGSVIYLGRPCQYVTYQTNKGCNPKYWASHRYAPEVIESLNETIDFFMAQTRADEVVLVGYSGGGATAALIAVRRTDVSGLITIAANLDAAEWTKNNGLTPLYGSDNPAAFADPLSKIRQIHFVGEDDDIVPQSIVQSYQNKMKDTARIRVVILKGFSHDCCWVEHWPDLLDEFAPWSHDGN